MFPSRNGTGWDTQNDQIQRRGRDYHPPIYNQVGRQAHQVLILLTDDSLCLSSSIHSLPFPFFFYGCLHLIANDIKTLAKVYALLALWWWWCAGCRFPLTRSVSLKIIQSNDCLFWFFLPLLVLLCVTRLQQTERPGITKTRPEIPMPHRFYTNIVKVQKGKNLKLHTHYTEGEGNWDGHLVFVFRVGDEKKRQKQMHWLGIDNSVKLTIFE